MSDQSIRRWVKAGELRAYKPKKEYRIAESDLEEFLKERRVPLVQAPLPDFDEERRIPTAADFQAVGAIKDLCKRMEAFLEHTASLTDPDDMDKALLRAMLAVTELVGRIAPSVAEKEAARPLHMPVARQFVNLGYQLVAKAREWDLPEKEATTAQRSVTDMRQWSEERAS